MNVPAHGRLCLRYRKNPWKDIMIAFFPFFQKGFYLEIVSNNILALLCRTSGLAADQVRGRVQTVFLNGKPVDDMGAANVRDGDCLALSAAMPGLVGATMRSGGILASFRHSISHRPETSQTNARGGILCVKLFNLLIKEIGPRFLEHGILLGVEDLQSLLSSLAKLGWKDCTGAQWNTRTVQADSLPKMEWPEEERYIGLQVVFE